MAVLPERSAEYENTCDAALWLIRRKYLYKYVQMRHGKKNSNSNTNNNNNNKWIIMIVKMINQNDNKYK